MELRQHLGIVKTRKSQKAEKNANRNSRKKASKNISLSLELEAQEATSKELVWKEDVHGRLFENVTSFFDDGTWSSRLCIRVLRYARAGELSVTYNNCVTRRKARAKDTQHLYLRANGLIPIPRDL